METFQQEFNRRVYTRDTKISVLYAQGWKQVEISGLFGMSQSRISEIIGNFGSQISDILSLGKIQGKDISKILKNISLIY